MKPKTTSDTWQKIAVGLLVLSVAGVGYLIFEPGRRAERVHQAIRQGASFKDVESLLTGRYLCSYRVKTGGTWNELSRSDIADAIADDSTEALRLSVTFLGISPYRVSLDVDLDRAGNVTSVAAPYGWDRKTLISRNETGHPFRSHGMAVASTIRRWGGFQNASLYDDTTCDAWL